MFRLKQELIEDLISQKTLLQEMNSILKKHVYDLEANVTQIKYDISEKKKTIEELQDDKKILTELARKEPHQNKTLRNVTIVTALGLAIFIFISYLPSDLLAYYNFNANTQFKTEYLIQNLKGDTVATWKSWNLVSGQVLNINIVDANHISLDKLDAIKSAILDKNTVNVDNSLLHKGSIGTASTYYLGWQGALENISHNPTKFQIPTKFNIIESPNGSGDITIFLTNLENTDGYTGYTKSITDGNQIVKSSITIYNVDSLTPQQLAAIVRHEFGHAMGLAHSTDPEDLMHATIQTDYPFISKCDTNAIKALYDGKELGNVECRT